MLMWNCFQWFQTSMEPPTQTEPGRGIILDACEAPESTSMTVRGPDGRTATTPIDPDTRTGIYSDTSLPGFYQYSIGTIRGGFAVNAGDPDESDISPTKVDLKAEEIDADELAGIRKGGRSLWVFGLMLAGILAAYEAVVFHRRIYF